ncbi:dentin matrix acidic phosphoprotein 1-like [Hetaerina americana]|uniref:dentin matrix acidic phosphoprotein 1-like n=1 Tax=Hetaerina americana TaxID=62018 RepID=UPI003A7F185D
MAPHWVAQGNQSPASGAGFIVQGVMAPQITPFHIFIGHTTGPRNLHHKQRRCQQESPQTLTRLQKRVSEVFRKVDPEENHSTKLKEGTTQLEKHSSLCTEVSEGYKLKKNRYKRTGVVDKTIGVQLSASESRDTLKQGDVSTLRGSCSVGDHSPDAEKPLGRLEDVVEDRIKSGQVVQTVEFDSQVSLTYSEASTDADMGVKSRSFEENRTVLPKKRSYSSMQGSGDTGKVGKPGVGESKDVGKNSVSKSENCSSQQAQTQSQQRLEKRENSKLVKLQERSSSFDKSGDEERFVAGETCKNNNITELSNNNPSGKKKVENKEDQVRFLRETEAALKSLSGSWPATPNPSAEDSGREDKPAFENLFEEKKPVERKNQTNGTSSDSGRLNCSRQEQQNRDSSPKNCSKGQNNQQSSGSTLLNDVITLSSSKYERDEDRAGQGGHNQSGTQQDSASRVGGGVNSQNSNVEDESQYGKPNQEVPETSKENGNTREGNGKVPNGGKQPNGVGNDLENLLKIEVECATIQSRVGREEEHVVGNGRGLWGQRREEKG